MTQPVPPDRFLALLNTINEMTRSEESSIRQLIRALPNPDSHVRDYINLRTRMYELVETLHQSTYQNEEEDDESEHLLPRIQINLPVNWEDPVAVVPTNQQIDHAILDISEGSEAGTCAICQDTIEHRPDGCRLRNCGHRFHDTCIHQWFTRSVRCPVCRNDIRESTEESV